MLIIMSRLAGTKENWQKNGLPAYMSPPTLLATLLFEQKSIHKSGGGRSYFVSYINTCLQNCEVEIVNNVKHGNLIELGNTI